MATEMKFYGFGLPNFELLQKRGKLVVIEGPDCSGRSTQIELLKEWLEASGYAVLNTGLKRSRLVGDVIQRAKKGNILGKTTLSLLYCCDFADQLENQIIPALSAGFIVLADRYIFTLMARDIVRGADKEWLKKLLGFAVVPDLIIYLDVSIDILLTRTFQKYGHLDYWESGMDIQLSADMFESFKKYHFLLKKEYEEMAKEYNFVVIDGNQGVGIIQKRIREEILKILQEEDKNESVRTV